MEALEAVGMVDMRQHAVGGALDDVRAAMAAAGARLEGTGDPLRHYHRLTSRVLDVLADTEGAARFADPGWVARFQVAAARRYLAPLERRDRTGAVPGAWSTVYGADVDLPPLRHLLAGALAARDHDQPLALLDVLDDAAFADAATVSRHARDHVRLDELVRALATDVVADLPGPTPPRVVLERLATRLLTPTRWGAWRNARLLSEARHDGHLAGRIYELETRVVDRVGSLVAPGPGLLRLARGVSVELPPWGRPD